MPSLAQSILFGSLGFGVVSVGVFATVAFGERWMFQHLGEAGAYGAWALLFMLATGGVMSPLVIGPEKFWRFCGLFALAFFIYAGVWVGTYLSLHGKSGELLASVLGPALLGMTLAKAFDAAHVVPRVAVMLSLTHATGYFIGELLYHNFSAPLGMLLWGVSYGLGFGAGIGRALYACQEPVRERLNGFPEPDSARSSRQNPV